MHILHFFSSLIVIIFTLFAFFETIFSFSAFQQGPFANFFTLQ